MAEKRNALDYTLFHYETACPFTQLWINYPGICIELILQSPAWIYSLISSLFTEIYPLKQQIFMTFSENKFGVNSSGFSFPLCIYM